MYWQLKRWVKYQHRNQNRWWIYHRYFQDNHFTDQRISEKGIEKHPLYQFSYVPIRYHVKIKAVANTYLQEYDRYYAIRTKWRDKLAKERKQITTFMSNDNNSNDSRALLHWKSIKSACAVAPTLSFGEGLMPGN